TEETYELLVSEADRLLNTSHPLQLSIRQSQALFLRHLDKADKARTAEEHISAFQQKAVAEKMAEAALSGPPPGAREMKGLRKTVSMERSRMGRKGVSPQQIFMVLFFLIVIGVVVWMLFHVFNMKVPHM